MESLPDNYVYEGTVEFLADGIPVYCSHSEIVNIESVVPQPKNPNKHNDKQIELLAKIIKAQGWRNPIVVSNRSGFVVKGHGRLMAAQKLGVSQVPIDRQDYASEAEEYADLLADNKIAELSKNDKGSLKDLLAEVDTGIIDIELTGFTEDEIEKMMTENADIIDKPEIELTPELFEEHNILVLYFDNSVDWNAAIETFGLKIVTDSTGMRIKDEKTGKTSRKSIGRVVRGADIVKLVNSKS